MFETSLCQDRFAEFIKRFEVERQGLFSMLDGLFVGFPPRIVAFERRKIGQIVVGMFLDRETIRSSILFPLTSHKITWALSHFDRRWWSSP